MQPGSWPAQQQHCRTTGSMEGTWPKKATPTSSLASSCEFVYYLVAPLARERKQGVIDTCHD